jgi:arginyl-tRNA--protein-N-Asp/Glu arginylyltransferase
MAQVQLLHRFGVSICDKLYAKPVEIMRSIISTGIKTFAKLLSKALDDCHRCCSIDSVLWIVQRRFAPLQS